VGVRRVTGLTRASTYQLGGILLTVPRSQRTHPGSAAWAVLSPSWARSARRLEILSSLSLEGTCRKLTQESVLQTLIGCLIQDSLVLQKQRMMRAAQWQSRGLAGTRPWGPARKEKESGRQHTFPLSFPFIPRAAGVVRRIFKAFALCIIGLERSERL
jgi:hypothetical protein